MKYSKRPPRTNIKRRMPKRPKMAIAKLSRAVKKLQSMNDGEKKRITTLYSGVLGQVNVNAEGAIVLDVTPGCTQGNQTNQRNGASLRLHSTRYQFQLSQLGNLETACRYKMTWFAVNGAAYGTDVNGSKLTREFFPNVYQPNPFVTPVAPTTGIRDYHAQYNPDYFNTYKVIRTVRGSLLPDQLTGTQVSKSFGIGLKYNRGKGHDVRYNQNLGTTDNVFNGQIVLVIQLDRGNSGTSPSTTVGALSQAAQTGIFVQYNKTDYFYDN